MVLMVRAPGSELSSGRAACASHSASQCSAAREGSGPPSSQRGRAVESSQPNEVRTIHRYSGTKAHFMGWCAQEQSADQEGEPTSSRSCMAYCLGFLTPASDDRPFSRHFEA
jgi:hypothetical protein